jgi:hypothetical protein
MKNTFKHLRKVEKILRGKILTTPLNTGFIRVVSIGYFTGNDNPAKPYYLMVRGPYIVHKPGCPGKIAYIPKAVQSFRTDKTIESYPTDDLVNEILKRFPELTDSRKAIKEVGKTLANVQDVYNRVFYNKA